MRSRYYKLISLLILHWFLLMRTAVAQGGDSILSISETFQRLLANNRFSEAAGFFDSSVRVKLSPEMLETTWNSLQNKMGKYKGQGPRIEEKKEHGYSVVLRECVFERGSLELRLAFNNKKEIAGIFFRPMEPEIKYRSPAYDREDSYQTRILDLENGDVVLPGRLLMPAVSAKKKVPVVILVHGSGPQDMDESIGPNKPLRDLATGLASKGVATYRYDKRTLVYGDEMALNKGQITIYEETVNDALAAIRMLKEVDEVDTTKIFVLGHSLGGMLAPLIAEKSTDLNGIILLAANARPLEDLIWDQMNYLLGLDGISAEDKATLKKLKSQIKRVKSRGLSSLTHDSLLPFNLPANYWLGLKSYDQTRSAKNLDSRILVLQGARDYQVTLQDFETWKRTFKGKDNVEFILYPELNHLFLSNPSNKGLSTPEEYRMSGNIPELVIDDILNWIGN